MGRKNKKYSIINSDNENDFFESESASAETFSSLKPLWEIIVLDAENELLDFTIEFENTSSRFKWLNYGKIINAVENILFCKPNYINFKFNKIVKIDYDIYDYITGVINILNLKNKPLVNPEYIEYTLIEKLTKKETKIITTSINDPRLDNIKYFIYEELIDSDVGVVDPINNFNKLYIYLNNTILHIFSKYYKTNLNN